MVFHYPMSTVWLEELSIAVISIINLPGEESRQKDRTRGVPGNGDV